MMGKTMLFKPSERLFNKSANFLRGQRLLYKRVWTPVRFGGPL